MYVTLDFETRSTLDLKKVGIYRYTEHHSTHPLCMAWRAHGFKTRILTLEQIQNVWDRDTRDFILFLETEDIELHAHNAAVERLVIENICGPRYGWPIPRRSRWRCSAARMGKIAVPRKLEKAALALGVAEQKDMAGNTVMRRLCKPIKWDGDTPVFDNTPAKFEILHRYCMQDVNTEEAIEFKTFPLTPTEQNRYLLVERMNDRGVRIDMPVVKALVQRAGEAVEEINRELKEISNGAVPTVTKIARLKTWIENETGVKLDRLRKEDIEQLDPETFANYPNVKRAIVLRQLGAKSSVSKLTAIMLRCSDDGLLRGAFMSFATSTGRLTSVGVQLQNLIRECFKDTEYQEKVVNRMHKLSVIEISMAIRGVFIPNGDDHVFVDADFNAIEARGVAWLAGAKKLVRLFETGGDPYCATASGIYSRVITKKDEKERWTGKQTVLGCGYGMGAKKFEAQCLKLGQPVTAALAQKAVKTYREEYPEIPALWRGIEKAALQAVEHVGRTTDYNGIEFRVSSGFLQMRLPSGRRLYYKAPVIRMVWPPYDSDTRVPKLYYLAEHPTTKQWQYEGTWGGKLVENAVQALCNDLLMEAQIRIEKRTAEMRLSVHDQAVIECHRRDAEWTKALVQDEMERGEWWSKGFPIKAEPKILERFGK